MERGGSPVGKKNEDTFVSICFFRKYVCVSSKKMAHYELRTSAHGAHSCVLGRVASSVPSSVLRPCGQSCDPASAVVEKNLPEAS
jgi:hypothetical protein